MAIVPLAAPQAFAGKPASTADTTGQAVWAEQKARDAKTAPLNAIAAAAEEVGRNQRQDIFSGLQLSDDLKAVHLYLTDPAKATEFKAAMLKVKPGLKLKDLAVRQGKNTRVAALAEAKRLLEAKDLPFKVYGASWTMDGAAVKLDVDRPAAVAAYTSNSLAGRLGYPALSKAFDVRAQQGQPIAPATRENASSPFYGGAAIGRATAERASCTTGIPVVDRNGKRWITTAAHCVGANPLFTHGGNRIGNAWTNPNYDVAFIDAYSARYTWDGLDTHGYTRYLEGWSYASNNQEVCHLGYNSMVVEKRIPCRHKVVDSEFLYRLNGHPETIKGVKSVSQISPISVVGGDSGGPVVAFGSGENRIVKGFVSGFANTNTLVFVDFQDINRAFSVNLP
ncbi:S1 family peptidase [Streptomyces sp. RerS4]|uniref:S1 family peptidase n=1 Tax=Streptomyces sp. RerS4 TaxID=2942449 RepID=UPI00201C709A|nr:S1 family peptidase [Streptomyces sp. RerS4]UQW99256.1 S1 family peptidase [Streptomyces sp. RerS4]